MSFSDVVEAIKTLSLVNRDEVLGTRCWLNTVRLVAQVILFAPLHPRHSMCGRRRIPTRTRASPILGDFHKSASPKVGGWGA
jgi:hypothetical protein